MKIIKLILIAAGFAILFFTVRSVGIEELLSHVSNLGWRLIPLLMIYPVIFALDTLGWAYAFPERLPRDLRFKDLYLIRIIGETLNAVLPFSASLGGEPVKVELLKRRHGIPASKGYASLLIVHTTFWISLNVFVIGGVLLTLKTMPLTPVLRQSVLAFLAGLGVIAGLLIAALHFGIFKQVHAFGEKFRWWGDSSKEKGQRFLMLDDKIKKFYTSDKKRFLLSSFFNFLGWFAGTFEVYAIGKILGLPIGFQEAWLLEALIQVLRIVTFFIPSSIGTQEGGIVLIFSQFGFAGPVSLAFAVIRRLREMIWIGLGLLLWSLVDEKR